MTIFWIVFPALVFIVVLSWMDLKCHVGYSFSIALSEGFLKLPLIWLQSFIIPVECLNTSKSQVDLAAVSKLERGLRLVLSKSPGVTIKYNYTREDYWIQDTNTRDTVTFAFTNDRTSIDGTGKLIPPRVVAMMLAAMKMAKDTEKDESTGKSKSLFS